MSAREGNSEGPGLAQLRRPPVTPSGRRWQRGPSGVSLPHGEVMERRPGPSPGPQGWEGWEQSPRPPLSRAGRTFQRHLQALSKLGAPKSDSSRRPDAGDPRGCAAPCWCLGDSHSGGLHLPSFQVGGKGWGLACGGVSRQAVLGKSQGRALRRPERSLSSTCLPNIKPWPQFPQLEREDSGGCVSPRQGKARGERALEIM